MCIMARGVATFLKVGGHYINHKLGVKCPKNLLSAPYIVFKSAHIKKSIEGTCIQNGKHRLNVTLIM